MFNYKEVVSCWENLAVGKLAEWSGNKSGGCQPVISINRRNKLFHLNPFRGRSLNKHEATLECFIYWLRESNGIFSSRLFPLSPLPGGSRNNHENEPTFSESIRNTSAVIGKDAVLNCYVESLGMYKVGWMRSDQTVLSVGKMVTQNTRYSVSHEESNKWSLRLHNVRESDEGCYLCQINTQPLLKQSGCIQLNYPPDISDEESSTDTTIHEGRNATLHCSAKGNPTPRIFWRRDDGIAITVRNEEKISSVDIFNGSSLKLVNVRRDQMSAYLCIAVNGVEPAISKRIFLRVQCELFLYFLLFFNFPSFLPTFFLSFYNAISSYSCTQHHIRLATHRREGGHVTTNRLPCWIVSEPDELLGQGDGLAPRRCQPASAGAEVKPMLHKREKRFPIIRFLSARNSWFTRRKFRLTRRGWFWQ